MKKVNFSIIMPPELLDRIKAEAALDGRSASNMMLILVRRGLEARERETLSAGSA
jgi:hypothetical protein